MATSAALARRLWPFRRKPKDEAPNKRDIVRWDPSWSQETVQEMYRDVLDFENKRHTWPDTVDTKVVAVFSVFSLVAGLAPKAQDLPHPGSLGWWLWAAAFTAWLVSAVACARAYFPQSYRVGPDPNHVGQHEWYRLSTDEYRVNRLVDMAKTARENGQIIEKKTLALKVAIVAGVVEVGLLVAAVLFAEQ